MSNYLPLHNQQVAGVGIPPAVPLMKKQSEDRLRLLGAWQKGLIEGCDIVIAQTNTGLSNLQKGSPEFEKVMKYGQRCIEHKMMILQAMAVLAAAELSNQKFAQFWLEQKELPDFPVQGQQVAQPAIDPRLPIVDGKPVGKVRADGAVDISGDGSTSIPINGVLSPEQAKKLGVVGKPGPAPVMPIVNAGGVISPEQQRTYIKQEEEKAQEAARNVGGNGIPPVVGNS